MHPELLQMEKIYHQKFLSLASQILLNILLCVITLLLCLSASTVQQAAPGTATLCTAPQNTAGCVNVLSYLCHNFCTVSKDKK